MQFTCCRLPLLITSSTLLMVTMLIPGCATRVRSSSSTSPRGTAAMQAGSDRHYIAVDSSLYDALVQTVRLHVHSMKSIELQSKSPAGEQVIDVSTDDGAINYALSHYPTKRIKAVRLFYQHQTSRVLRVPGGLTEPDGNAETYTATFAKMMAMVGMTELSGSLLPPRSSRTGHVPIPPPGAKVDKSIHGRVKQTAPVWMKENAVINEARSKRGTPYIWGHNEDRGQYGFDCSNFTAYVYHHALGYKFTGASRGQAKYVGVRVPISDMRRGDLIVFEHGKHVGIYAGKHRMIQEGGGIGKVGYLPLGRGSYWGKHITSVKRLF